MTTPRQALAEAASYVRSRITGSPQVGIVLGSGLMHLTTVLEASTKLSYAAIPHFPLSHVKGHQGALHVGRLGAQSVACLAGRVHGYEGYAPERVVFGVRMLAQLGCSVVLLTNAAGAVTRDFPQGSLMLISDHLNLTGSSPLIGWNEGCPQFVDMTEAYDCRLRTLAMNCATQVSVELREGVYAGLSGPSYETPAEVRMLAQLGASAVGMSTVHETIALRDLGVRVLGLSCITNAGAGIEGGVLNHEHVQEIAHSVGNKLEILFACLVRRISGDS
jgi:purine-nucleoside phosphorylase